VNTRSAWKQIVAKLRPKLKMTYEMEFWIKAEKGINHHSKNSNSYFIHLLIMLLLLWKRIKELIQTETMEPFFSFHYENSFNVSGRAFLCIINEGYCRRSYQKQ